MDECDDRYMYANLTVECIAAKKDPFNHSADVEENADVRLQCRSVTLISPFVGHILDWYKKNQPGKSYEGDEDPGVQSVKKIFNYYKQQNYKTIVMGTSSVVGEIKVLTGVDFLTISPALLEELEKWNLAMPKKVDSTAAAQADPIPKISFIDNEPEFHWTLLQDAMAFDKLHESTKKFPEGGPEGFVEKEAECMRLK